MDFNHRDFQFLDVTLCRASRCVTRRLETLSCQQTWQVLWQVPAKPLSYVKVYRQRDLQTISAVSWYIGFNLYMQSGSSISSWDGWIGFNLYMVQAGPFKAMLQCLTRGFPGSLESSLTSKSQTLTKAKIWLVNWIFLLPIAISLILKIGALSNFIWM